MKRSGLHHVKTISEYHQAVGFPKPEHPLISIFKLEELQHMMFDKPIDLIYDFYCISLKQNLDVVYKYGQQQYDFDEGQLFFMSPKQIFSIEPNQDSVHRPSGWVLFFHPDFLWNTKLAQTIKQYDFFDYSVNEALYLSAKEEKTIISILKSIKREYHSNIDKFSQDVIVAQLELLLTYSERFYQRQFLTRKISNHQIVTRLDALLASYFENEYLPVKGLPTVKYISDNLNISPAYLRNLLKTLTGMNTQQHIHEKLIEKAKEKLAGTHLSVTEIAYEMGFEHAQSFCKFFKLKTKVSPLAFRQSFN